MFPSHPNWCREGAGATLRDLGQGKALLVACASNDCPFPGGAADDGTEASDSSNYGLVWCQA